MLSSGMQSRLSSHLIKVRPFLSQRHPPRLGGLALHCALPNYGRRTISDSSEEGLDTPTPVTQAREHKTLTEVSQNKLQPRGQISAVDTVHDSMLTNHLSDERMEELKACHAENSYVKLDAPWGFVVYRAVYGKESDEPWERMLGLLRPRNPGILPKQPWQLDPPFELTVMKDEERFAGADSHTIREAFREWVANNLPPRVQYPEREGGIDSIRAMIRSKTIHEPWEWEPGEILHPWWSAPPRWCFCLFVDDICLRSLNHEPGFRPVVKIVNLRYNKGRCENIADGWEDGETDDPQEDVGWMYMNASSYKSCYEVLEDGTNWEDEPWYMRPAKEEYPTANDLI
jgi:hypothetical protein